MSTLGPVSCGQADRGQVARWLHHPGGEQDRFSQKGAWLGKKGGVYSTQGALLLQVSSWLLNGHFQSDLTSLSFSFFI